MSNKKQKKVLGRGLDALLNTSDDTQYKKENLITPKSLEIDIKKVNLDGGAISLGHPLGATGARITGKAAELLIRENKKYALATQCIGYGMGIATVIESVD